MLNNGVARAASRWYWWGTIIMMVLRCRRRRRRRRVLPLRPVGHLWRCSSSVLCVQQAMLWSLWCMCVACCLVSLVSCVIIHLYLSTSILCTRLLVSWHDFFAGLPWQGFPSYLRENCVGGHEKLLLMLQRWQKRVMGIAYFVCLMLKCYLLTSSENFVIHLKGVFWTTLIVLHLLFIIPQIQTDDIATITTPLVLVEVQAQQWHRLIMA